MHRTDDQVPGFSGADDRAHGIGIADFPDGDDLRLHAQSVQHAFGITGAIDPDAALRHHGVGRLVPVQARGKDEFDRVFQCHHVVWVGVNQVLDDGRQRGGLAGPGRPGDQDQTLGALQCLHQLVVVLLLETQLVEVQQVPVEHAHGQLRPGEGVDQDGPVTALAFDSVERGGERPGKVKGLPGGQGRVGFFPPMVEQELEHGVHLVLVDYRRAAHLVEEPLPANERFAPQRQIVIVHVRSDHQVEDVPGLVGGVVQLKVRG